MKNKKRDKVLPDLKKLFSYNFDKGISDYSIVVNGKSDSNSLGDFSTIFFMLPYLYSPQKENLKTAFIGLGTGISAGAYSPLEDVKSIEVLEISPFVIKAIKTVPPELNFHVTKNKKVKIIETDAFKYFTRNNKKFDIIVSEPSNPWVTGVENLFTLEFYKLISQSLNKDGIFGQWLHIYDMDLSTLKIVIKTINQVFPYANLYKVGHGDILIVASSQKLKALSKEKFNHPFVKKFYNAMGFKEVKDLYLSQILNSYSFDQVAKFTEILPEKITAKKAWFKKETILIKEFLRSNSFIQPQLIYRANKTLFLGSRVNPFQLANKFQPKQKKETEKIKIFNKYKDDKPENWNKKCLPTGGFNFLCALMHTYNTNWKLLKDETKSFSERFPDYIFLRQQGLIPYNKKIMDGFLKETLKQTNEDINLNNLSDYVFEKIQMREYKDADKDALAFKKNKLIDEQHYKNFKADLENARKFHKALDEKDKSS